MSIRSIVWRGVLFRAEAMMAIGKHSKEIGLIIRIIIDGIIPMQVHLKVDSIRPNTRSVRVRLPSPPPKKSIIRMSLLQLLQRPKGKGMFTTRSV